MVGAILAVRFKGLIDVREEDERTLKLLRLERPMTATLLPNTSSILGMLRKVQHYVAWCPADPEVIELLLEKRGEASGRKRLTDEMLVGSGFENIKQLAQHLSEGKVKLNRGFIVKPVFRLSPPRGGFKARKSRLSSEGGIFGHNPNLNQIIKKMI